MSRPIACAIVALALTACLTTDRPGSSAPDVPSGEDGTAPLPDIPETCVEDTLDCDGLRVVKCKGGEWVEEKRCGDNGCANGHCSGPPTEDCQTLFDCLLGCNGNTACSDDCEGSVPSASQTARDRFEALAVCMDQASCLERDASYHDIASCVVDAGCALQLSNCMFDTHGADTCRAVRSCAILKCGGGSCLWDECVDKGTAEAQTWLYLLTKCAGCSNLQCRKDALNKWGPCEAFESECKTNDGN